MGVGISGDNSSYTVTITGMSTSIRYHVFIADLNTDGTYGYYYCRRSSLGTSSSWSYSGKVPHLTLTTNDQFLFIQLNSQLAGTLAVDILSLLLLVLVENGMDLGH